MNRENNSKCCWQADKLTIWQAGIGYGHSHMFVCGSRALGAGSYLHNYEPLEPSHISCKGTLPRLRQPLPRWLIGNYQMRRANCKARNKRISISYQQPRQQATGTPDEIKSKHSYKREETLCNMSSPVGEGTAGFDRNRWINRRICRRCPFFFRFSFFTSLGLLQ